MPDPTRCPTEIKKNVVCRVFIVVSVLLSLVSCEKDQDKVEKGVSLGLAKERKANIGGVSYRLSFSIPVEKGEAITAESVISFELLDLMPLVLDFKESEDHILSVTSDGKKIPYTFKNEHIIIQPKYLQLGRNELTIEFKAGESALNRSEDMMYTLLVPDRCRTLMPCFDQPDIKARFKLMLKIPSKWRAIANGEPLRVEYFNDYKLYEFAETKPLSTYLFAFTVGRFEYTERYIDNRWIGIYHRETDTAKINASIPEIVRQVNYSLGWMERYTGIRYPFDVYNVVAIPAFQFGGMEHPGAVYYLSDRLFLERNADQTAQMRRSELIAHETAHMWFGDYVTMKWFDDVWLKEVFAGFIADKIMTQLYPEVDHQLNFFLNHYEPSLRTDRTKGTHPILQNLDNLKDAGTLYGDIIYHKAPIVMRMLEREISEPGLRMGLQRYLRRWSYSNADWEDLIRLLENTSGKNLEEWNEIWIKESGAPVIEFESGRIAMIDESGQKRVWPQAISILWDYFGGHMKNNVLVLRDTLTAFPLPAVILPDADVLGYGCFLPTDFSIHFLDGNLSRIQNSLYRAVAWQLMYEGVLHKKVKGEFFVRLCIKHLPLEKDNLIVNRTLSFMKTVYTTYLDEGSRQLLQDDVERFCLNMVSNNAEVRNKKSYFNTLQSIYSSPKVGEYMTAVLTGDKVLDDVTINDNDRISIAFNLALRDSNVYQSVETYIKSTVKNKDLMDRFSYVLPSLSGNKLTRDSVFDALLIKKNRKNEVWAGECLKWLNHPRRRMDSEDYIPKILGSLQEIQETGDIFFPSSWLSAGLSGHTSKAAYASVNSFLEKHPNYPQNLKLKILSNSDHLRRLHSEEYDR